MVKRIHFHDLNKVVNDLLGNSDQLVVRWWKTPNKAFNGQTPFDTFLSSPETVKNYLLDSLGK